MYRIFDGIKRKYFVLKKRNTESRHILVMMGWLPFDEIYGFWLRGQNYVNEMSKSSVEMDTVYVIYDSRSEMKVVVNAVVTTVVFL